MYSLRFIEVISGYAFKIKNTTNQMVEVYLENRCFSVQEKDFLEIETKSSDFEICFFVKRQSRVKCFTKLKLAIIGINFNITSRYRVICKNDISDISLTYKQVHDSCNNIYEFIEPLSKNTEICPELFSVYDEDNLKKEISFLLHKNKKWNKLGEVLNVLDNLFMFAIPMAVIIIIIGVCADWLTALYIAVLLILIGVTIAVPVRKIVKRCTSLMDNSKSSKDFCDKSNKDIDTFFDSEYIKSVVCSNVK